MTFPIDQFMSLARANGQLALKLAEIARTAGEDYLRLGSKTMSGLVDQTGTAASGMVSPANSEAGATILAELEQSREAAVAKSKAAFEDWQAACKDVWASAADTKGATEIFERFTQPWLKVLETARTAAPTPATAEVPATASPAKVQNPA